ncbi:Zinc finger BED domain-containing protein RICESLEEPER 2, partial [Pseudolycoriella hygida]
MESSGEIFDSEVESSSQGDANSHTGEENHENNDDDGQNNDDDSKKKRSPIWNHFSIFTDKDGKTYARCKQSPCTKQYLISGKSNSSTGNLIRHLENKHPGIYSTKTDQDETFVFKQEKFRQALLKWVVMCGQPFSAPKDQAFVDLMKCLNPLARIVCDKTIRADLMVEYERKVEELKTELAAVPGKISITLDGWTSKHGLPFLAIRGYWVDEQWQLKSKLLDFAYIEGNHDGRNHSIILSECLRRLNVRFSEILGITADNASSNDKLFDWLDSCGVSAVTSQIRCLAHVINLAVQDMLAALKVPSDCDPEYDESLENE